MAVWLSSIFAVVGVLVVCHSSPVQDSWHLIECPECFSRIYSELTHRKSSSELFPADKCDKNMELLNFCMKCPVSDSLRIAADLREIHLAQEHNGCYNRSLDPHNCETVHECLYEVFDEDQFSCDSERRESARQCLSDLSQCRYGSNLAAVLDTALDELCEGASCLYTPTNDIYRTVEQSNCTQYTLLGVNGVPYGPFDTAAGTVFDTRPGYCSLKFSGVPCFN